MQHHDSDVKNARCQPGDEAEIVQSVNGQSVAEAAGEIKHPQPVVLPNEFHTDLSGVSPEIPSSIIGDLDVSRSSGKAQNSLSNIQAIIDRDPVFERITRFDRATGQITFSPRFASLDHLHAAITEYLSGYYTLETTAPKLEWIVNLIAYRNQYNSVVQLMNRLGEAPPENPIDGLVERLRPENPDETPFIRETLDLFFQKHNLQIIVPEVTGGELRYPNDVVPVLRGGQGIGKTLLIRGLSISPDYYLDVGAGDLDDLGTRDGQLKLTGKDLVELGEYRSPKTLDRLKSLASMTTFEYRPPYARGTVSVPRTASFLASTNTVHYLTDGTGNRRFFPVNLADIDRSVFSEDPELFRRVRVWYWRWAQKWVKAAGDNLRERLFDIHPSKELEEHLSQSRQLVRHVDATEESVERYFDMVREAVESGDWHELSEQRTTQAHYREYYAAGEAVQILFPRGNQPKDFYRVFSEVATREGMKYIKGQIGKSRIRLWVPKERTTYHVPPPVEESLKVKKGGSTQGVTGFQIEGGTWDGGTHNHDDGEIPLEFQGGDS